MRQELMARLVREQAARDTFLATISATGKPSLPSILAMTSVDSSNQAWLRPILLAHGWPRRAVLDSVGIEAVFLIVQHADRDPEWQAAMLPQLKAAHLDGELDGQSVALLTDRVAKAQHRPQVYGTQTTFTGRTPIVDPIEDSAHVDERRASMGLPPLAVYMQILDSMVTSSGKH